MDTKRAGKVHLARCHWVPFHVFFFFPAFGSWCQQASLVWESHDLPAFLRPLRSCRRRQSLPRARSPLRMVSALICGSSLNTKPENNSSVNEHHTSVRADARFARQSASNKNGVKWKPWTLYESASHILSRLRIVFLTFFKLLAVRAETDTTELNRTFHIFSPPAPKNPPPNPPPALCPYVHIHAHISKNKSFFLLFFEF